MATQTVAFFRNAISHITSGTKVLSAQTQVLLAPTIQKYQNSVRERFIPSFSWLEITKI